MGRLDSVCTADDHPLMGPDGEHHSSDDARHGEASARRPSSCAPLSRGENEILDGIEHDLVGRDPGLSVRMAQLDDCVSVPTLARIGGALAFGLMLLVFVLALPVSAALVLVGLVAAAAFLPLLLSGADRQ